MKYIATTPNGWTAVGDDREFVYGQAHLHADETGETVLVNDSDCPKAVHVLPFMGNRIPADAPGMERIIEAEEGCADVLWLIKMARAGLAIQRAFTGYGDFNSMDQEAQASALKEACSQLMCLAWSESDWQKIEHEQAVWEAMNKDRG